MSQKKISEIEIKFVRLHGSLDELRLKVNARADGVFKQYEFSKKELYNDTSVKRVTRVSDAIYSNMLSWQKYGKLTQGHINAYKQGRERVHRKLKSIYGEISKRKDPWWVRLADMFREVVELAMKALPLLSELNRLLENLTPLRRIQEQRRKLLAPPKK